MPDSENEGDAQDPENYDPPRRRSRRGQTISADAGETVSRQLEELQRMETSLSGVTPQIASNSPSRVHFGFLQNDEDVEVSPNRLNSFAASGTMESIVEGEERSSPRSPELEGIESNKRTQSGRRTLMARTKLSSQIDEVEILEQPLDSEGSFKRPPIANNGSFYFSHTPDDTEELERTGTAGSTEKVLEAVKQQLLRDHSDGVERVSSDIVHQLSNEFHGIQRDSNSTKSPADARRTRSSGDVTEVSSTRSSAQKSVKSNTSWAFKLLRGVGSSRKIEVTLAGNGSDGESDAVRPSPLRKALTLKAQVLKPMMNLVGVVGSGRLGAKQKPLGSPIAVPHLPEEEEAAAANVPPQRAMGGALSRPLNDLTGQYIILGDGVEHHDEDREEKRHLVTTKEFSHNMWQWYAAKAAQVRNSEAARSSKVLSRILRCMDPNRDQDESNWMANGVQYLRCIVALGLVVLDLVTVLMYQVFWGDDNFLCHNDIEGHGPSTSPVVLLGTSTVLHFLDFCYLLASRDPTGKFTGLSYFKKGRDVVGRSSRERRLWYLMVFILSTVFFICNVAQCNENFYLYEDTYRVWVLRRCLFFFLCLRAINSVQMCFGLKKEVKRRLRIAVSQNKRRFVSPQQDIDLDLTYVCDRLIGMSLPCVTGVVYRNQIADVARFFRERHYGKYKVYNLCEAHESKGNGNYDCALLYHQVQKFPFRDHNAPPLETLVNFCEDATAWLNEQTGNVVAVHCQGGKGRTGTFCSSLMLWVDHKRTAEEALKYFESRRQDENKGSLPLQGVTAPSQIRYVSYLENIIQNGVDFVSKKRRLLRKIILRELPRRLQRASKITLLVEAGGVVQYDHGKSKGLMACPENDSECQEWVIHIGGSGVVVSGDVAVRFYVFSNENAAIPATQHQGYALRAPAVLTNGGRTITYDGSVLGEQLCFVQFHTSFHEGDIEFSKEDVDGAYNKSEAEFGQDFAMELLFGDIENQMQSSHDRAVRNCTLSQTVYTIMKRIQPRTRKFYKGEVIYDHVEKLAGRRVVRYIVSGTAKQYMTGTDETKSVINNGVSLHGECISAGEFDPSGILAFIMGHGCINPGTELRAWTEIVEVRELLIGGSPDDMITHLSFHNATHEDSAIIWELIAYQLSSAGKKSWVQKKEVAKNVDEIAQHRIRAVKLVKEARNHFSLSSSEHLLGMCQADRVVEDEGGVSSVQGHVIALQNWVLFREGGKAFKDKPQDLMVSFENITKVLAYGKVLSIHLSTGASSQIKEETAIATTKPVSPPRSPLPGSPRFRLSPRRGKPVETKGRAKPSSSYSVPGVGGSAEGGGFPAGSKQDVPDPWGSTTDSARNAAEPEGRSSTTAPDSPNIQPSAQSSTSPEPRPSGSNGRRHSAEASSSRRQPAENGRRQLAESVQRMPPGSEGESPPGTSPTTTISQPQKKLGFTHDGEITRLHFRARDSHNASSIAAVLQTRLADIQEGQATTTLRSSLYGPFGRVRPGYMGFGYAYPGEVPTEGDQDFFKMLAMASTVCTYHAGETMVHLGTTDRNVLHILSGWVVCYSADGEQVAQLGPGEILGEVSFLEMGSLGARTQCVAHTDVECRVVSYAALQVLSRQPLFAARFYRGLAITCAVRCLYSLDSLNVRRRKFSTEMPVSDGDLVDHSVD